ncbi:glycosyltransferase family 9 protein [Fluviicola sp. SGL-29]|nr:glycosyltransferase family 9 protein [Fluviicola sp. SGL-29]
MNIERIIISRTDSIGDVLLTLPICNWIKQQYPNAHIIFLGKNYTLPILKAYTAIDEVCDWSAFEELPTVQRLSKFRSLNADAIIHVFPNKEIANLAKKVKIPHRIGTSHRSFHLLTCNHKVNFTRKRSDKHESQLNFELLRPLGLKEIPSMEEIAASTALFQPTAQQLPEVVAQFIEQHPDFVILHPKSQGSALEWPTEKYAALSNLLNKEGIAVAFTGTEKEGVAFRGYLPGSEMVIDTSGLLTLEQLMTLIGKSRGIVACSTGPLHIGGFLGVKAVGLFSSRKPIHPGRWHAIGKDTHYLVNDENCPNCAKKTTCKCIENIAPERVSDVLMGKSS